MDLLKNFSEQLAELIAEDNYTHTSLAAAMNTSRPKISLYLSAKRLPDFKSFVALIEFFNCSANFILGLSDFPNRNAVYKTVRPFKERLCEILKEKEVSQYKFIKETKISWSVFHGWRTGKSLPSVDNIVKIADYFECTVDYLLGRE